MKARSIFFHLFAALLVLVSHSARAEDIDLFLGTKADKTKPPNLMLVFANSAHSSNSVGGAGYECKLPDASGVIKPTALSGSALGVEQCALYSVIESLDTTTGEVPVKLGIMMFNGTMLDFYGTQCVGSEGGCLLYKLTDLTTDSKKELLKWIASWNSSGNGAGNIKANGEATASVAQEAWAYLTGRTGLSGRNYSSIKPDTECKNFVVFVYDAATNAATPGEGATASPKTALENAPGVTALQKQIITFADKLTPPTTACGNLASIPSNHENSGFYADEWTRYMAANRISSYTVGFLRPGACKPEYPWLLSSMATNGGGAYFPTTNYQQLIDALKKILSEVRSVNSVFAAVSLPVSVNSQGTYLNQVFIGMFRPDPNGFPRWFGNLKQYKMGFLASTGQFSLLDADGERAISASGSEFIAECARSFWTPTATTDGDKYWTLLKNANCADYPATSNSPDGNLVEKGAQGYMLRKMNPATRLVQTCDPKVTDCTALKAFDTSNGNLNTTTLGWTGSTPNTLSTTTLISWARGANANLTDPEKASLDGTNQITNKDMRPSAHGDVVHSRPAAINFGADNAPKVVVFYGGNDGMLRAINGNRSDSITVKGSSVAAGDEFWSFVPPEFHPKLMRRYNNTDTVDDKNRKDYAMDGPIAAYRPTTSSDAQIFVGMRRGGRTLYSFNVANSNLDISLKWKIGCMDDANTNCSSADFKTMGQTWSPPQVLTVKAGGANSGKPMLIMGGGYNPCEDADIFSGCANPDLGKGFYVLDLEKGTLLAPPFPTARGVIADVTIVPDTDGSAKYIYGADLGGNVYRISGPEESGVFKPIADYAIDKWVISTVAQLGCDSAGCTGNRKFFFAPDVVVDGNDYVLLLGSGDREKPTNTTNSITNYFFMVKDRPDLGSSYLSDATNCTGFSALCTGSLTKILQDNNKIIPPSAADLASKKGWYLQMAANEQVVTGAIAVFGTVYFTTHTPTAVSENACVPNLGVSRAYGVHYTDASGARTGGELFIGRSDAGLAPDLVVGKVTLDNNSTVPFCIGCDGPIKPSQPVAPGLVNNPAKIRSYWYIQK